MIAIAEESRKLAPMEQTGQAGLPSAGSAREPLGTVMVIAPWNYPYLTANNTILPALDGGQRGDAQARDADTAGGRALRRGVPRPRGCRTGCSRTSCSTTPTPKS
jgi:hypothetical protein